MHRLFVALSIPERVKEHLASLQSGLEGARWVDPEDFHLTLRFVGEVDGPTADDLASALSLVSFDRFSFRLSGFGHFERKGRPEALWVAVEDALEIAALKQKVEAACRRVGLPPDDRKFIPHVTLARLKGQTSDEMLARWIEAQQRLNLESIEVSHFTLYESHLGRDGPLYDSILEISA